MALRGRLLSQASARQYGTSRKAFPAKQQAQGYTEPSAYVTLWLHSSVFPARM